MEQYQELKERYIAEWNDNSAKSGYWHPTALISLCNAAVAFIKLADYEAAVNLLQGELGKSKAALGEFHAETVSISCLLASSLYLSRSPDTIAQANCIFQALQTVATSLSDNEKACRYFQMLEKVRATQRDFTAFLEWEPSRDTISAISGHGKLSRNSSSLFKPAKTLSNRSSSVLSRLGFHISRQSPLSNVGRDSSEWKGKYSVESGRESPDPRVKLDNPVIYDAVLGSTQPRIHQDATHGSAPYSDLSRDQLFPPHIDTHERAATEISHELGGQDPAHVPMTPDKEVVSPLAELQLEGGPSAVQISPRPIEPAQEAGLAGIVSASKTSSGPIMDLPTAPDENVESSTLTWLQEVHPYTFGLDTTMPADQKPQENQESARARGNAQAVPGSASDEEIFYTMRTDQTEAVSALLLCSVLLET